MHLNPYGEDAVRLAVDLANTPPATLLELVRRCRAAGLVLDMEIQDADLAAASAVIDRWRRLVGAAEDEQRAGLLNDLLADVCGHPRLTAHAGTGWHLHYRDDGLGLPQLLEALLSVGTALHLTGRGMHRLGRCAAVGCHAVFADFSRGGRQRYCTPRCTNRDAVRRHRTRQPTTQGIG